MSQDDVYKQLQVYLQELFEIAPDRASREARLFEDLDLDSIDAVDLVVKLQELTGRRIAPKDFKSVRTVGDVVDRVHDLLAA